MIAMLQSVLKLVGDLPPEDLPRLLGDLREIEATALGRLSVRAAQSAQPDELIDVEEAARRLGVCRSWLYHHHRNLPFGRRMGRKLVFSSLGIERYIRARR